MTEPSDDEVDRLLARGGLGSSQREKILRSVLASTAAQARPARRRWWIWSGGSSLVLAAGVAAVLLWPRVFDRADGDFRAKGSPSVGPRIEMSCLSARLEACPRGSLVAFEVGELPQNVKGGDAFVTAYADPATPGERIWYLNNAPIAGAVPQRPDGRVVPRAAKVGDEHVPGGYRVEAILSRRPLSRDEALGAGGADVLARGHFDLVVLP